VLGLIFLKYISDAFIELYDELSQDKNSDPEELEEDGEVFEEKMKKLTAELSRQMQEEKRLDEEIKRQLSKIGLNLE
jgi:type I restriction enzyme M protein